MIKQRGSVVRKKIIDVAARLFYEQGYHVTGINQVIDEADIAKASLYKHFESKTDLLLAYLEQFHLNWFEGLETFIGMMKDPKEKLLAIFDYRIRNQQKIGFGGCALIKINNEAGTSDPRILEEVQKAKRHFKALIAELVKKAGHRQILSDDELADTIYLMAEGGVTSTSIFKDTHELQIGRNALLKLL